MTDNLAVTIAAHGLACPDTMHHLRKSWLNLASKRAAGTLSPVLAHKLLRNNAADAARSWCRANGGYFAPAFKAECLDAIATIFGSN